MCAKNNVYIIQPKIDFETENNLLDIYEERQILNANKI